MMKKNKKKRKRRSIFVFLLLLLVQIQTSISCFLFLLFHVFPIFLILLLLPASTTKPHFTVNTTTMNKQLSSAYTSSRIRTDLRRCGAVTSRVARPNGSNTTLQIVRVGTRTQIQYHCEFHHPLWYIMHSYDHRNFIFSVLTCSMRCFKRSNSSRCFSLFIKS